MPPSASRGRTCLVTGAAGFVGTALLAELASAGWDVVATSRRSGRRDGPACSWVRWDAVEGNVPNVPWSDLRGVVHLVAPTTADVPPKEAWEVAVESTATVAARAREAGVDSFVHVSSGSALDPTDVLPDERAAFGSGTGVYGAAKAASELAARALGPDSTAVVRLFHPYGPGGARFLVNRVVDSVADGRAVPVERDGGVLLAPVWIDDVARGLRLALESEQAGTFHLAGPDVLRLRALVELVAAEAGAPVDIEDVDRLPPGGHAGSWALTKAAIGYVPRVSMVEGIRRLLADRASARQRWEMAP